MSDRDFTAQRRDEGSTGLAVLRWTTAIAIVLGAHAALAVALRDAAPEPPPAGAPQAPILIDLAPPAAAPEIAPVEASEPEAEPATKPSEPEPEPVAEEPPEADPEPVVEEPPEPEPEPVVEPEPEPPVEEEPEPDVEPPEVEVEAEAVLNVPLPTARPTPPPRRTVEREEPPREEPRRRERQAQPPPPEPPRQRQAAAPSAASQGREQRQASQGAPAAPSVSPAQWQGQIQARLNRFKRRPPGGGRGTAQISFTIAGSGAAGGIRIARSSGNPNLDQAAAQLVQRASPFPAPPGGAAISLTVPIQYD